jgi:hypothetical protein
MIPCGTIPCCTTCPGKDLCCRDQDSIPPYSRAGGNGNRAKRICLTGIPGENTDRYSPDTGGTPTGDLRHAAASATQKNSTCIGNHPPGIFCHAFFSGIAGCSTDDDNLKGGHINHLSCSPECLVHIYTHTNTYHSTDTKPMEISSEELLYERGHEQF